MNKSKGLTFVFSFIPGLGHFYLGAMNRGLQLMIGFFGAIFITNMLPFIGFAIPVIWFFGLFDALQQHRKMEESNEVIDTPFFPWEDVRTKKHWLGWALIIFGIMLMVERISFYFFGIHFYQLFQNMFFGVLLILLGWMLISGKNIFSSTKNNVTITDGNTSEDQEKHLEQTTTTPMDRDEKSVNDSVEEEDK